MPVFRAQAAAAGPGADRQGGQGGLAALLEALEAALPEQAYLDGLIRLVRSEEPALRRRALRLFASKVAASAQDAASNARYLHLL